MSFFLTPLQMDTLERKKQQKGSPVKAEELIPDLLQVSEALPPLDAFVQVPGQRTICVEGAVALSRKAGGIKRELGPPVERID